MKRVATLVMETRYIHTRNNLQSYTGYGNEVHSYTGTTYNLRLVRGNMEHSIAGEGNKVND